VNHLSFAFASVFSLALTAYYWAATVTSHPALTWLMKQNFLEPRAPEMGNGTPATELLAEGLATAKEQNKRVFVVFSMGSRWCRMLDKYHADPEVRRIVEQYFVLV